MFKLNELKGMHLQKTNWFELDKIEMTFMNGKRCILAGEGECCNEVWIEDVDDMDALQDCTILEINPVVSRQESFFLKIKTTKGYATLSVRNNFDEYAYDGEIVIESFYYKNGKKIYRKKDVIEPVKKEEPKVILNSEDLAKRIKDALSNSYKNYVKDVFKEELGVEDLPDELYDSLSVKDVQYKNMVKIQSKYNEHKFLKQCNEKGEDNEQ